MTANFLVTSARNDRDLARELGSSAIPCAIPCGDINFYSCNNLPILVERKHPPDMASCILSSRYLNQLQNAYTIGFRRFILLVEGEYRPGPDGLLYAPTWRAASGGSLVRGMLKRSRRVWQPVQPAIAYSRFAQFLFEVHDLLGVFIARSQNVKETVSIVNALWVYFQKPRDDHQSLHQIYSAPHSLNLLGKPSVVRRVASQLDNIGWERAKAVEARFRSVREMCAAGVGEWQEVDGVGKKIAQSVVSQLGGKI